ncbi:hypothetical protein [Roseovarius phycicola]|uniref:Lipoprotein n=1 Tax=Roseovarius phycicola TaxID=3080976 RepID=A0ABZ2HCB5_9RHOB
MIKKCFSAWAMLAVVGLSGCVAPDVVSSHKIEDGQLSCHDIALQMQQLEDIRAHARKGKTMSGANVAAAVFFWPAVIGNYANANEAIEASNKREAALAELARDQGCRFKHS